MKIYYKLIIQLTKSQLFYFEKLEINSTSSHLVNIQVLQIFQLFF